VLVPYKRSKIVRGMPKALMNFSPEFPTLGLKLPIKIATLKELLMFTVSIDWS